ncbi:hypothetical protein E2C01_012918 [Portunus trituberculatus]|uniref:Uncharacterized protein n=1 Tax=Portunus trituberculatus TaxID=210409 RepID=A0A5B7DFQ5_PORTR|nr:hypothetical protein [Portunus trituberculatus]
MIHYKEEEEEEQEQEEQEQEEEEQQEQEEEEEQEEEQEQQQQQDRCANKEKRNKRIDGLKGILFGVPTYTRTVDRIRTRVLGDPLGPQSAHGSTVPRRPFCRPVLPLTSSLSPLTFIHFSSRPPLTCAVLGERDLLIVSQKILTL